MLVTFLLFSAAGDMLPPMVVYKSQKSTMYKTWTENGPDGSVYTASDSGWFDMGKFNQWFTDVSTGTYLVLSYLSFKRFFTLFHLSKRFVVLILRPFLWVTILPSKKVH
jgi:hypothetical protein